MATRSKSALAELLDRFKRHNRRGARLERDIARALRKRSTKPDDEEEDDEDDDDEDDD